MAGTPPTPWRIHGLDGLRAIAIIAVLVFHVRPASLRGGFIGVDVFFVISGYLITTLLLRELAKNGRIDLPAFWVRRARRLLPALVTVVVASTVLALVAGGDLLVDIGRHIIGAVTFSNNWLEIGAGSSYFEAATPNLFVNFWSLAVEEQFYLVWPVITVVLLAAVSSTRLRIGLLAAGALASALAMALLLDPDAPTRVYYGTDTHAFGLLIGAGLALALAPDGPRFFRGRAWQRWRFAGAGAGAIALVVLMMRVDGAAPFAYRGGLVLASLATAAIIAALPGGPSPLTRILEAGPLAWIGRRSYGIYMWHWPVLLIVTAVLPAATADSGAWWAGKMLAVGLTIALAAASFTWIENPVRRLGFIETLRRARAWFGARRPRGKVVTAAAGAAVLAAFVVAWATAPTQNSLERAMAEAAEYVGGAAQTDAAATPDGSERVTGEITGSDISSFGDSMLYVAAPALAAELPGIDIDAESNRQWPAVAEAIDDALAAGTVRDVVIIAAGTNAGARDVALIDATLDALGPDRSVVLVNIYGSSFWVEESNDNLAAVAAARENVAVADWHQAATEHPDRLQPDRTHPDMEGMYLYSAVVQDAFGELGLDVAPEDTSAGPATDPSDEPATEPSTEPAPDATGG
nr:acyltransferase family protein [Pseudactinotalea sp. HY160]